MRFFNILLPSTICSFVFVSQQAHVKVRRFPKEITTTRVKKFFISLSMICICFGIWVVVEAIYLLIFVPLKLCQRQPQMQAIT